MSFGFLRRMIVFLRTTTCLKTLEGALEPFSASSLSLLLFLRPSTPPCFEAFPLEIFGTLLLLQFVECSDAASIGLVV